MGIVIISVSIFLIGLFLLLIYTKCRSEHGVLFEIGKFLSVFGIGTTILLWAVIGYVQLPAEGDYKSMVHEKAVLEYRLSKAEQYPNGNSEVYDDLAKFNNRLRATREYVDNFWVNWFFNEKIATIDFIDYEIPRGNY